LEQTRIEGIMSGFGGTGKGWWAQNEQLTGSMADSPAHRLGDYGVGRGNGQWNMALGKGAGTKVIGGLARRIQAKQGGGLGEAEATVMAPTQVMPKTGPPTSEVPTIPNIKTAMSPGVSNPTSLFTGPKPTGASPSRFQTMMTDVPQAATPTMSLATTPGNRQDSFAAGMNLNDVRSVPGDQSVAPYDPQARFNFPQPALAEGKQELGAGPAGIGSQPALGFTPRRAAFSQGVDSAAPETAEILEMPKSMGMLALNAGPKPRRKAGLSTGVLNRIGADLSAAPFSR
jgi:hypothetical protein